MREHPIENLMSGAMTNIKDMIDVNTIIGDPIETNNNIVIIPISKVSFGFAAGGSEFNEETIEEYKKREKDEEIQYKLPFGGGSGAGVSINPVAFLVVQEENVKLLPINHSSAIDKLLDYVPDLFERINEFMNRKVKEKYCQKIKEVIEPENLNNNSKQNNKGKKQDYTYKFEYDETEEDDD
jgi:sporulation protein YtfJ